ncbi:MAG: GNAT family N-acetyltransferase [Planctomycetota bacterium]
MKIETKRLLLRPWQLSDQLPFAQMLADPDYNKFMPGPFPPHKADQIFTEIQNRTRAHQIGPLVVELPRQEPFLGYLGLTIPAVTLPFSPCVEIGWHLVPRFWGQGYATEGAVAVLKYGFEQLELEEVVAFTVPENLASRGVMEKIGMTQELTGDFDHPALDEGHPLRRHVLYRIQRDDFNAMISTR